MRDFTIALGSVACDVITGFVGRVTGRVQYITGCNQYLVQPGCEDGKTFVEARWFDEHRLEVSRTAPNLALPGDSGDGADAQAPVK
jgi:hypothetical protein